MSDDDEYYEWDEEYLFEDVVPDLVDDLAATAHYEAALYEDPGCEVEEYFSDWEYYSDDYYDDDPSVNRNIVRTKALDQVTKARRAQSVPKTSSHKLDISTFQSVIWKTSGMEKDQDLEVKVYEPGNGVKLAFLADWREIFKSAQPALDKSRLRRRRVPETKMADSLLTDDRFADDESGFDEADQLDSSDEMTDVLSLDHVNESGDAGEGSNTTPEPPQPAKDEFNEARMPARRGRKRKAEAQNETDQNDVGGSSTRARSKRVALDSNNSDKTKSAGLPAPVRRSTRQKK